MDANRPVVSVIIPAYNGARFVAQAVESALGQTVEAIEVLAIDDGSTDDTVARLARFTDPRLRVFQQPHRGAPAALNIGVQAARGEFLAFLDHDDLWTPRKLERHVECFRRYPEAAVTFSWYRLIDEQGEPIHFRTPRWHGPIGFGKLLEDYVVGSTSSLMIRRGAVMEACGFDEQFPRCHDFDLVLRISLGHPERVRAVPEELAYYRRHSGQMSRDWRSMHSEWNSLLEKIRGLAPAETAAAERVARTNINRYHACLAYEESEFREALGLIRKSLAAHPRAFLADWRSWRILAACWCGALLPTPLHRGMERLAGIRRDRQPSKSTDSSLDTNF